MFNCAVPKGDLIVDFLVLDPSTEYVLYRVRVILTNIFLLSLVLFLLFLLLLLDGLV